MPPLTLILLLGAIALLALIPTRRLFLAGWSPTTLSIYFLFMVTLGVLVAELRGPARFLIPILVVAYLAPFVTARAGVGRMRERLGGPRPPKGGHGATPTTPRGSGDDPRKPPIRNVTPPDDRAAEDRAG